MIASGFSWMLLIPGVEDNSLLSALGVHEHTYVILHAWLVCAALIGLGLLARRGLDAAKARGGIAQFQADNSLTVRNGVEILSSALYSMFLEVLGSKEEARRYFGFLAALFTYILACNLLATLPGFQPPTDNVNTNVGLAVIVFLLFNYVGLSRDFWGFLKHLCGPVLLLAPLLFPIEVFGLCMRGLTLTIRLTANIYGDHTLFSVMSDMVPVWLPVPSVLLVLATFVSAVQAFVFTMLTTIYIALSLPHHEDEGH